MCLIIPNKDCLIPNQLVKFEHGLVYFFGCESGKNETDARRQGYYPSSIAAIRHQPLKHENTDRQCSRTCDWNMHNHILDYSRHDIGLYLLSIFLGVDNFTSGSSLHVLHCVSFLLRCSESRQPHAWHVRLLTVLSLDWTLRPWSADLIMASPSPEKDNFLRIAALLMDGGTKLLRGILDSIHNTPASLSAALAVPKTKKELRKTRLSPDEWNKLYPAGGPVKLEDLDITLLSKVLRHACSPPLIPPYGGWDTLPLAAHQSPSDDLVRIRIHRNEAVAHAAEMKLEAAEFERIWNEISEAMIRLAKRISTAEETKWKALVEEYRSGPVTCEEEKYVKDLESWYERDRLLEEEMRARFQGVDEGIAGLSKEISTVRELVSSRQGMNAICLNETLTWKISKHFREKLNHVHQLPAHQNVYDSSATSVRAITIASKSSTRKGWCFQNVP